ncbi:glycosyl-4,4'-diaponeurosporenoate acyltransferase [Bacillus sp. 2205SS5-2]|uniref:glycosyl-4,4'-diaponeurosporenoate acyltransferase CrtO family protein n=1 Tax=Bacillus sp. 2205SS5-2 TaxID=3109031 RepID=UPI00300410EE
MKISLLIAGSWLFIHLLASWLSSKFSKKAIETFSIIFEPLSWEKNDAFYRKWKINRWQKRLPDARNLFFTHISGKKFHRNQVLFEQLILETKRSELAHWLQILPSPFFFLFGDWRLGFLMVVYACVFNFPFILIQRYNRVRLTSLVRRPAIQFAKSLSTSNQLR